MIVTFAPSVRRWTAMLCALLILLFAGVQGTNALDRMQHDFVGATAHEHGLLSALTVVTADPADHAPDDAAPTHHHHNADHGAGMPASPPAEAGAAPHASLRPAIPHIRANGASRIAALERPPRGFVALA